MPPQFIYNCNRQKGRRPAPHRRADTCGACGARAKAKG